ncbi:hypothetical protein WJX72_003689 [[Myrmecia] bisecta]|uniref:Magnesium transporter n=1 Tax=[Myrmecia] bisecta TaxID=41462 RepID=A0AAW1PSH7_9CHLO
MQRESRARRSTWLLINTKGQKSILHADKRAIIQKFKLGIPIRDMRLLDPNLLTSETGKILVRDNAIVFSIEHVRLIITADAVIIPREGFDRNPINARFNALLEESIVEAAHSASRWSELGGAGADDTNEFEEDVSDDSGNYTHVVPPLPFELLVLEVALGDVCALASQLTKELEAVAHPALDELTKHVNTPNLERVRKVKTRHQRLFTRIVTVREELQRFLEDDDDMMKMCLTRKKEIETGQAGAGGSSGNLFSHVGSLRRSLSIPMHTPRARSTPQPRIDLQPADSAGQQQDDDDGESIEAVENLLESYFMQIDSTYDRIVSIGEYVKDTEEYINIELDSSRNQLIKLEVWLTTATFAIALWALVAGILGENLTIPEKIRLGNKGFWVVNGMSLLICIGIFYAIIAYIRRKRLM